MKTIVRAGFKPAQIGALLTLCLVTTLLAYKPAPDRKALPTGKVRFAPVHIYLDPGGRPLAAYQFELVCSVSVGATHASPVPEIKIVGVEGGEHPAFKDAPYYDPAALMNDRIIIAAFNTGRDLPTTRTRIATLHLQIPAEAEPQYELKLVTAADASGEKLPVSITLEKGEQK